MIVKYFEINKIKDLNNKLILLHGKNEGLKTQTIQQILSKEIRPLNYEEKEVIEGYSEFIESILNKSLFDSKKTIVIKRATDKIIKILDKIRNKNIEDTIIISSENLDKKSKLRTLFEKEKNYVCVPFYPDNEQTLLKFAQNFLREKNISVSTSNINILVSKCNGERENLSNELNKIEFYSKNGREITSEVILKLSNLTENHNISVLIDNCLIKNEKKTIKILNENSFSNDDCILIIRTFISKSKKLLNLSKEFENNRNIDQTLSSAKPPIFWKDKEITKKQIILWNSKSVKRLIYKLTEIELQIKKNYNNPINLITDFILNQIKIKASN